MNPLFELLRWNKPSGRLILLIPAGWSLWLTPSAPPSWKLVVLLIAGALCISGAGCIANDLWDKRIDKQVARTKTRPLAKGSLKTSTALWLLFLMLLLSLWVVFSLPISSRALCLKLSIIALPFILIYPSAKRWFKYPQFILSICWGFAALIPWAASQASLAGGVPLISCYCATMVWTFGFDTVYAMADKKDDESLGLYSSALSLGEKAIEAVSISYAITSLLLGSAAIFSGTNWFFWPFWLVASFGMQREIWLLKNLKVSSPKFKSHFRNQVRLGGLTLIGLIIGNIT